MTVMPASKSSRISDGHHDRSQCNNYQDKYSSPSFKNSGSRMDHYSSSNRHHKNSPGSDRRVEADSSRGDKFYYSGERARDRRDDYRERLGARTVSNSSENRTASKADAKEEEEKHKAEVAKAALHVCGDWSSHKSSSGKVYFYNCKTEVSQWEKPKEWTDLKASTPSKPSGAKDRIKSDDTVRLGSALTSQHRANEQHRHLNGERRTSTESGSQQRHNALQQQRPTVAHSRQLSSEQTREQSKQQSTQLSSQRAKENGSLQRKEDARFSGQLLTSSLVTPREKTLDERLKEMMEDGDDSSSRKRGASPEAGAKNAKRKRPSTRPGNGSPRQHGGLANESVDMDISPSSSPPHKTAGSQQGHQQTYHQPKQRAPAASASSATPSSGGMPIPSIVSGQTRLPCPVTSASQAALPNLSQDIALTAMKTLYQLQQAISRHCPSAASTPPVSAPQAQPQLPQASPRLVAPPSVSRQDFASPPAASAVSSTTPSASGERGRLITDASEHSTVNESPRSEHSSRSSGSAAPASRQTAAAATGGSLSAGLLAAAAPQSASRLLDSEALKQHVQSSLTAHVQNWAGIILEQEAERSAHVYQDLSRRLSGELAARLKCSRSVVRDHELQMSLTQLRFDSLEEQLSSLEEQKAIGGGSAYLPPPGT